MRAFRESALLRIVKRACSFILAGCFLIELGSNPAIGQAKEPARIFRPALEQIKSKTRIPILLPSKLPTGIPENAIKLASGEVSKDGYFISLYYSEDANASYAAGFGGSTLILQDRDLPNSARVALSDGRTGISRPVSCGGSCAPANLWLEQNGVMYQIQVKLRPDLPENDQQKILVETANSTVAVRYDNSVRQAALSEGLLADIEAWRALAVVADAEAWVFPSQNMTPLSKDNCWRRNMLPKLGAVGLAWANFQVMRRTHVTLMKTLGADGKLVADQLGHTLDVNQNVYTQSPVEIRAAIVNRLEDLLVE